MTECPPDTAPYWDCVTKGTGTLSVTLSAFAFCANYWEANEQIDLGEFAWPTKPVGFVLECTTPGRTSAKEPRWSNYALGDVVPDGSVVWTLRTPDLLNGIQPITSASASDVDDLQVSGVVVIENTKILADYIGGTPGTSYRVPYSFTIAGRILVGSQTVHVVDK